MRPLVEQLTRYATYHRDRRNIATHFFGIPMILFSIIAFMARPAFVLDSVAGVTITPAHFAAAIAVLFYLRLDLQYAVLMALVYGACVFGAMELASQSTAIWLGVSIALFVVGWVFQLVGHVYEGKKPAFLDDMIGLLVGPLFVVAEAGFAFGYRRALLVEIEKVAGPTRINLKGAKGAATLG